MMNGPAIPPTPEVTRLNVVLFSLGEWRVGLEAKRVRGCRLAPAAEEETEQPCLDLEKRLGLSADPSTKQRMILEIAHPDHPLTWRVTGPVVLHALPIATIHPLPRLLAARTRLPGLRALALTDHTPGQGDGLILLLDVDQIHDNRSGLETIKPTGEHAPPG
ncbi:MAG: hypothetical protein HQL98_13270 [Magnetococcales bacterium]|nr:hypothetical protein [Magnetococcales bacterium]